MKKEYKDLEVEVVTFEDIITASGGPGCGADEDICIAPAYGDACECVSGVECIEVAPDERWS